MTKHCNYSEIVLTKSFAFSYGQVNELYDVFFLAPQIAVNGHVPAESGPCPLARSAS